MQELSAAVASIDRATWITIGCTLLGLLVAHVILSWAIKYKAARETNNHMPMEDGTQAAIRRWIWRGALRCIRPLAFLIWVNGLYVLATTLVRDLEEYKFSTTALAALEWWQGLGTLIGITWLLVRIGVTTDTALRKIAARHDNNWSEILIPFAGRAVRWVLPLIAVLLGAPALAVSSKTEAIVKDATSILLIATLAYMALQLIQVGTSLILTRQQLTVSDNRRARAIYTQVTMLRKIVTSIVALIAVASMLMVFDSVRHFGTAIIASAGVGAVILGFAAQKSIATLLAGIQIALTQPIRIDDVVIVEGEWGRIEEITLTYVVVCIWDWRRLVLPISYFIEKPFQNWTRTTAEVIGSVFLYVDYNVPLAPLRAELQRILEASPLWDRKVSALQVTDTKQHTVEVRVIVSARDAGQAFDLRCDVRERLIGYLQKNYPDSLPRIRATLESETANERTLDAPLKRTERRNEAAAVNS
ncbi:mechanosensitive ion channel family protein [Steroidobacter flavus]|uniref:Mechanosensitive ion channel family protein n=1 Tax=Steroidobacter flavus TaxID=1842136 RepID=A0ABV8SMZ0_9GAMM